MCAYVHVRVCVRQVHWIEGSIPIPKISTVILLATIIQKSRFEMSRPDRSVGLRFHAPFAQRTNTCILSCDIKMFERCTRTLVTNLRYELSQNAFQPLIQRTTTCIMFCDTDCLEECSGPFRITQPTQTCALSTMVVVNLLAGV